MNHESEKKIWNDVNEENIPKLQELIAGTKSLILFKDGTGKAVTELPKIQDRVLKSDAKLSAFKILNASFTNYYDALKHRVSERGYKEGVTCFGKGIIVMEDEETKVIAKNVIQKTF